MSQACDFVFLVFVSCFGCCLSLLPPPSLPQVSPAAAAARVSLTSNNPLPPRREALPTDRMAARAPDTSSSLVGGASAAGARLAGVTASASAAGDQAFGVGGEEGARAGARAASRSVK